MTSNDQTVDGIDYDQSSDEYRKLANHIALVADAIARERIAGPYHAVVAGLFEQVSTLKTWTRDGRV